eukprot:m.20561 g.20561  ORF g.20561 m.20561 type:complete len:90 (-) comp5262_c0_seq1:1445-1714(-)
MPLSLVWIYLDVEFFGRGGELKDKRISITFDSFHRHKYQTNTTHLFPFARVIKLPPSFMNFETYESMRPAVVGPNDPLAYPSGVLAGPA